MQKYVEPVTISFIYILEPILSAVVAFFYLHEFFSSSMYVGEGPVLLGVVLQTTVGFFSNHMTQATETAEEHHPISLQEIS